MSERRVLGSMRFIRTVVGCWTTLPGHSQDALFSLLASTNASSHTAERRLPHLRSQANAERVLNPEVVP